MPCLQGEHLDAWEAAMRAISKEVDDFYERNFTDHQVKPAEDDEELVDAVLCDLCFKWREIPADSTEAESWRVTELHWNCRRGNLICNLLRPQDEALQAGHKDVRRDVHGVTVAEAAGCSIEDEHIKQGTCFWIIHPLALGNLSHAV